ncbi:MAG: hypothetical protein OEV44_11110 [Spirochaetota bacterium]|nr:hypothetical protein [Spirochaetota bacterium]
MVIDNNDFVKAVEKSRELIKSGKFDACPCSQKQCEWHGKCFECVLIHRVKKKHIPECLQPIFRETIKELASKIEYDVVNARPTKENWDYLKKISPSKQ